VFNVPGMELSVLSLVQVPKKSEKRWKADQMFNVPGTELDVIVLLGSELREFAAFKGFITQRRD
jgi:hypothetical protein